MTEPRDAAQHDPDVERATEWTGAGTVADAPEPPIAAPDVMELLAEHVPLALLVDLAAPDGPVSTAILETEGLPEDAWWDAPVVGPVDDDPSGDGPSGDGPAGDGPADAAGSDDGPLSA
ncbi:hypothetical protein [Cellulomonas fimi]|uniref:Uncharacterized protein n=1 Tax=Cellulomonas fimi TaxID=1708 RepID=A0A7Y0LZL3_CELFI|nr:hypothetical protein [Cellulomonas fimi]NMR21098.1 hypothetical protein [Cellulomonas fimi]